jgi:hypothetical protein
MKEAWKQLVLALAEMQRDKRLCVFAREIKCQVPKRLRSANPNFQEKV